MTARQTLVVALLTAVYLCVELAFNGRLLDVVGGLAEPAQIHDIEVWGRSLSGVAAALFLLQALLTAGNRWPHRWAWKLAIVFGCGGVGCGVFVSLQQLVDNLVAQSSPEFRRASSSMALVQHALVDGSWRIEGLTDDSRLFARPEGKAFLAQFPVMAVSVQRLDSKISAVKANWLGRIASDKAGGLEGAYDNYDKAVRTTAGQYHDYRRASQPASEGDLARQQDTAWNDYVKDLRKRRLTPYTVPDSAREQVLRKVRQKVPVPPDWDLADEEGFRHAVAQKMQGSGAAPSSFAYKGKRIPTGLSWHAFLAHPVVQGELRQTLKLTVPVQLQPSYRSLADFDQKVLQPQIAHEVRRELRRLDQPAGAYADGGALAQEGLDAARGAIVPPVALFFSMVGALGHLAKLALLLASLALMAVPAWQPFARFAWLAFAAVFVAGTVLAATVQNQVTESRLYRYLQAQVRNDSGAGASAWVKGKLLHAVAVGQGYAYPLNDRIRRRVLGGFSFGYQEARPTGKAR